MPASMRPRWRGCFSILTHGRRTALPRHQTLRATLDWSYRLLSPEDQAALRCLSVFNGSFTLEDAAFVMGPLIGFGEANDRLTSLLDKSFVVAKPEERTFRYRLLDTTRVYAQDKLEESGEANSQRRRHAEHVRIVFDRAKAECDQRPTADWLQTYGCELGNLRAALDWAFSKDGDGAMGAAITAAAAPIWFHLSLLDEGLSRVERAIAWLKDQPTPDRRLMMQLYAISGWPQMRAIKGVPSGAAAWRETLALAIELDDVDYQLRAIWALSVDRTNHGEAAEALALADRFAAVAERAGDSQDRMIGQRIRGKSLHYLGDFVGSRREIEQMLERYAPPPQRSHVIRFQYDQRLIAQITLVRGLWLQGYADQALALVEQMIAEGLALEHTLTLAHILVGCGVLHSVVGRRPAARRTVHEDVAGTDDVARTRRLAHLRRCVRRRNSNPTGECARRHRATAADDPIARGGRIRALQRGLRRGSGRGPDCVQTPRRSGHNCVERPRTLSTFRRGLVRARAHACACAEPSCAQKNGRGDRSRG